MASNDEEPLNFGAGPAKIPKEVLKQAQEEFLSYQNLGFSVAELSHRSKEYEKINRDAQNDIKELLSVPDNYKIIFVHGGGQGMFSAIAMNLMGKTGSADYAVTGIWSSIAAKEAEKYGTVKYVFEKLEETTGLIPNPRTWNLDPHASYFFYCDNETIEGVEFPFVPDVKGVPIVADMSSNIMTKKIDVSKFGLIFAATQKNLGTAGVAVVIIRNDLLGNAMKMCPSIFNFELLSNADSIFNTPTIFSIYMLGKVLKWIKQNRGLEHMQNQSKLKSTLLYSTLKNSNNFYTSTVPETVQSRINVPFRINGGDINLEESFLQQAEERHMCQLKGHRLVGGIRVSLFNAVSISDVTKLVNFMKEFQEKNQNVLKK